MYVANTPEGGGSIVQYLWIPCAICVFNMFGHQGLWLECKRVLLDLSITDAAVMVFIIFRSIAILPAPPALPHPPLPWWGYQLTKTVQNGDPQAISEILYIEYRIVSGIETYLIHIYHMNRCSNCNWNRYIEGFCMWNVHFHINRLSPNIAIVILMSWPLMAIYFLLLNCWLFSVQFSYHI